MKVEMDTYASSKLRSEMREKKVTTKAICKMLKETFEISLSEQSFNNKINRANFAATFFFQCMYVLNIRLINFDIDNIEIKSEKA
ncbi:MAG: DUF6471 domain-containing protein [Campylobacterales bacterium]|nr:DUF6471 domain-containing protein [Campylobacterales bacterium]